MPSSSGAEPPTRRYTYGFGRAEDLAGVAVVVAIAASTLLAGYASLSRLVHPAPVHRLWAVAGAALVGFCGNELAARYRIGVGRRIGSAALVADGHHARTDGFVSLGVLLGALGVAAGVEWADAGVGLAITAALTVVLWGVVRDIWRLMDAVDPELLGTAEETLATVAGIERVGQVRMRWVGHALRADAEIVVDESLTVGQAHAIAEAARHALLHHIPRLTAAIVHTDPCGHSGVDPHLGLDHHPSATVPPAAEPRHH